jgi:hypothetical protein
MAVDTILLSFCEDCTANNEVPQFAPKLLMSALGKVSAGLHLLCNPSLRSHGWIVSESVLNAPPKQRMSMLLNITTIVQAKKFQEQQEAKKKVAAKEQVPS